MKVFRVADWLYFLLLYIYDLILANLRLTKDILFLSSAYAPSLQRIRVCKMNTWQVLLLANLISMTPGTLTVDVSEDKQFLLVHLLYRDSLSDLEQNFIPRFYRLVLGVKNYG